MSIGDYRRVLCSPELERHALAGYLKFENVHSEIDIFAKDSDFVHQSNRIIFSVSRDLRNQGKKFDPVLLAQKIKDLGVSFKDDIDVFSYVDILFSSQINEISTVDAFHALKKQRILLSLCDKADRAKQFVLENREKDINSIVSGIDSIHGEELDITIDDEPVDLFAGLKEMIEERGANPIEEVGFTTGFPVFDGYFGGLNAEAGIYAVISRPGKGKSSWLLNIGLNVVLLNPGVKCLILDCEMKSDISKFRLGSNFSGVSNWYLRTGQFANNPEMKAKVMEGLSGLNGREQKIWHKYVGTRPVEEVLAIAKRWYYKYVGRGNPAFMIYDYIKLGEDQLRENWSEHQALGLKCNRISDFSLDFNIPTFVAMQANRLGEGEDAEDDSRVIGATDKLQHIAAVTGIFRHKRQKELELYGHEWGTHLFKPLKARQQGKMALGHKGLLQLPGRGRKKYVEFFINYDLQDFRITEKGSAFDIVQKLKDTPRQLENKSQLDEDRVF